jgi:hypothetical protein
LPSLPPKDANPKNAVKNAKNPAPSSNWANSASKSGCEGSHLPLFVLLATPQATNFGIHPHQLIPHIGISPRKNIFFVKHIAIVSFVFRFHAQPIVQNVVDIRHEPCTTEAEAAVTQYTHTIDGAKPLHPSNHRIVSALGIGIPKLVSICLNVSVFYFIL